MVLYNNVIYLNPKAADPIWLLKNSNCCRGVRFRRLSLTQCSKEEVDGVLVLCEVTVALLHMSLYPSSDLNYFFIFFLGDDWLSDVAFFSFPAKQLLSYASFRSSSEQNEELLVWQHSQHIQVCIELFKTDGWNKGGYGRREGHLLLSILSSLLR